MDVLEVGLLEAELAQFAYADRAPAAHLSLQLAWIDGTAAGRLDVPREVVRQFSGRLGISFDDEYMRLPVALSYAVLIAAETAVPLTITGDRTAWPERFGALTTRHLEQRSH